MLRKFTVVILFLLVSCRSAIVPEKNVNVVIIGAGITGASLGSLLRDLDPQRELLIFERLSAPALESSAAWNNAGTGHAGYCELNYTPQREDGSIDIKKAVEINEAFEISKSFWAYQVEQRKIYPAESFIHEVPHVSFVWGDKDISFLKKRYEALSVNPLFSQMQYSENHNEIASWAPLIMQNRTSTQSIAATRVKSGTDVDFGTLTEKLLQNLLQTPHTQLRFEYEVKDIYRNPDQTWTVVAEDLKQHKKTAVTAKYVFIEAGGKSLDLLQKTKIPQSRGLAGFPVGGMWLVSDKADLVEKHSAKVYGKAALGAPPMSVPHLDTRYIDGKKALLFGPFATFSTKFLKQGSYWDFFSSINFSNILPIIQVGWKNMDLTKYLIGQLRLTQAERVAVLREYFPDAKDEDWRLEIAGQRVQIIKNDPKQGGILQFGTEVVSSDDGTVAALLGASPGASTVVKVVLDIFSKSFKEEMATEAWQSKLKTIFPAYGKKLSEHPELVRQVHQRNSRLLGLSE